MRRTKFTICTGVLTIASLNGIASGQEVINEDFTNGPGCLSNYNADVFFINGEGELEVGTDDIESGGQCGLEYEYALCSTHVDSDFVLDADVTVVDMQEYRAGVVYGWTSPQDYYIFHLNDFENGVLQLIAFDDDFETYPDCQGILASLQFDAVRDVPYAVRIEVTGDLHRIFVNGNLEIEVTDGAYAGGQIGLAASFNGYGKFDNLFVTTGCPSACEADLNGDCVVGAADLAILLASWGECVE